MTINIFAHAHFDYCDSYGLIACQLARHLTALGEEINAFLRPGAGFKNLPPDIRRIVTERRLPVDKGGVFLGYPTVYAEHGKAARECPRIAITMFESSKLPREWAGILNDMDAVIVPGWFCRDVFLASGITAPIYVVPLGIGELYRYAERQANRPITFLAFVDRGPRKGGIVAKDAFLKAFGDDPAYRLILKQRKAPLAFTLTNPNIEWIQADMTEAELYQLYLRADVMISANRGEGFGLLPREFAATGGIALATDWGGTSDDLSLWGWSLPYTLTKADWGNGFAGQDLGEWAEPDEEGIVERLHQVAANIQTFRDIARLQAPHVAEMYSWRRFAESVLNIWRELACEPYEMAVM